jgi:hypothetical protein
VALRMDFCERKIRLFKVGFELLNLATVILDSRYRSSICLLSFRWQLFNVRCAKNNTRLLIVLQYFFVFVRVICS